MKNFSLLILFLIINIDFLYSQNDTYPNGQIKVKGNEENGEYIQYYENGQIREKVNYVDGQRNGDWIQYNVNGQIKEKSYKNGIEVK